MPPFSITVVRHTEESARTALANYLFAPRMKPVRAPRGLPPQTVSDYFNEKLKEDLSPLVWLRTGDVLRFYERTDVLETVRQVFRATERDARDLRRSAYALRIYGDLGNPEQTAAAAGYFDRVVVPHQAAGDMFEELLDTLVAIGPAGSIDAVYQRLGAEIKKAAEAGGPESDACQELSAVMRNRVPGIAFRLQTKRRLLAASPADRRRELVSIYLGQSNFADDPMQTWAARLLRREVMESDPGPVVAEFARVIEAADPAGMEKEIHTFVVHRAAQAILYFQGKLSPLARQRNSAIRTGPLNFLWDDLEPVQPERREQEEAEPDLEAYRRPAAEAEEPPWEEEAEDDS